MSKTPLVGSVSRLLIDKHGIIRWLNPAAQKLVGDVRGRQLTSIVAPENSPSLPTPAASAGQDVDQREEGDNDHRSDGHDRDCGSGEDHAPFLSRSSLVRT